MEWISKQIVNWCGKKIPLSEDDIQIMNYGADILIGTILKFIGVFILGFIIGRPLDVCLSLIFFCSMRYWAGGYHSNTHLGCFSLMLLPTFLPIILEDVVQAGKLEMLYGIIIVASIIVIGRFAPVNSLVNPIEDEKILRRNHWMAIVESCGLGAAAIGLHWQCTKIAVCLAFIAIYILAEVWRRTKLKIE